MWHQLREQLTSERKPETQSNIEENYNEEEFNPEDANKEDVGEKDTGEEEFDNTDLDNEESGYQEDLLTEAQTLAEDLSYTLSCLNVPRRFIDDLDEMLSWLYSQDFEQEDYDTI